MYDLEKIKSLYRQADLKEEYYALEIGISQSHFSNCINGKRKFSKKAISRIARFHNCSEAELFGTTTPTHSRIKKLTQSELDNIEMVVELLEHQDMLNDDHIRMVYHKLMDMIIFKREGQIKNGWEG